MPIYLKNARYIDWQDLSFHYGNMKIEAGLDQGFTFLSPEEQIPEIKITNKNQESQVLDCRGQLVMKSFACGHHHIYSALARGMPAPRRSPKNFHDILEYIWWHLDKCLDEETIRASALVTALYCAKNGVTFVIDHHASPFALENSLEIIAAAFNKVGISHLLCYEMSDRDGQEVRQKGLMETENYLKKHGQGLVGLHASFTVSQALLEAAVSLAEKYNSGIHIHVAEDAIDQEICLQEHQVPVIQRLSRAGALRFPKTILGHCLHIDPREREILRESPVYIAQNTESNLNNNVGFFDHRGLNDNIILGTDGMHSDMLRSAKAVYLVGQALPGVSPQMIYHRFRKVHHYLKKNGFCGDGDNNLVILDYDSPTDIHQENFYGHFIYGLESRHVRHVIANGRLIVENGRLTTLDEEEILASSKEAAKKLWQNMQRMQES